MPSLINPLDLMGLFAYHFLSPLPPENVIISFNPKLCFPAVSVHL